MSRQSLATQFVTAAAAIAVTVGMAKAGEVYLYSKAGPEGEPVTVTTDVPDLMPLSNQPIMAIVIERGGWVVCTEPNYQGDCMFSMEGFFRNMQNTPIGARTRSLRNAGLVHDYRWAEKLTQDLTGDRLDSLGLGGPEQQFVGIGRDIPDLTSLGVNFPVIAVRVSNRRIGWQLCSEPNYGGHCIYMVDAMTDLPAIWPWNVASVRQLRSGATSSPR